MHARRQCHLQLLAPGTPACMHGGQPACACVSERHVVWACHAMHQAEIEAELAKTSPLRGVAIRPLDIANAMLFLSSELGRCVNVSGTRQAGGLPRLMRVARYQTCAAPCLLLAHAIQPLSHTLLASAGALGLLQGATLAVDCGLTAGVAGIVPGLKLAE